ncbi:MAG: biopolymer transporter ExbD [Bacteroidales bacterium]|nr:biopolymer transporter ExbD [Bacteroidales bacterium]
MIQSNNKISPQFNSSSMSDLVFLLLIFFMLTSTLISPNAIKMLLPQSTSGQTMAKQNVTVSIDDSLTYYVENQAQPLENIEPLLDALLTDTQEGTVKLHADKAVPVQYIVNIIDVVNHINQRNNTKHKVILATEAPSGAKITSK